MLSALSNAVPSYEDSDLYPEFGPYSSAWLVSRTSAFYLSDLPSLKLTFIDAARSGGNTKK